MQNNQIHDIEYHIPYPPSLISGSPAACVNLLGELSGTIWSDGERSCNELDEEFCAFFGSNNINGEGSANEKCCICGGGSSEAEEGDSNISFISQSDVPRHLSQNDVDPRNLLLQVGSLRSSNYRTE